MVYMGVSFFVFLKCNSLMKLDCAGFSFYLSLLSRALSTGYFLWLEHPSYHVLKSRPQSSAQTLLPLGILLPTPCLARHT